MTTLKASTKSILRQCRGEIVRREAGALCGVTVKNTHEELSFAEAICADPNPTGLDPRLVYASYLEEQGDPRGELIRVECELRGTRFDGTPGVLRHHEGLFARRSDLRQALEYDRPQTVSVSMLACPHGFRNTQPRMVSPVRPFECGCCGECAGSGAASECEHPDDDTACPRCNGTGRVEAG